MTDALSRFLPTNAWLRMAIVPALVFIAMAADCSYLADFWHHLARGRAIVQEGEIIDRDLFTFTVPGRSFQDVNWLSQVIYYKTFQAGGLGLVRLVNALALALTLGWLVAMCRRRSGSLAAAAGAGILVFFGLWQILTVRPQTFSLLLFVLLYDLLDRAATHRRLLLLAPLVLALWANLHGAFPAGIMLIGCFALAAAWEGWREGRLLRSAARSLGLCLVVSLAVTLINPYGWRIYEYVGLTSNTAAQRRIDEWVAPGLDTWIGRAWVASLALMAGLFVVTRLKLRRNPAARDVILLACFLPLACGSVRMVAWWLLVCAPMAAQMISALLPHLHDERQSNETGWGAAAAFTCLLVLCVFSVPGLQRWNPLLAARLAAPRVEDQLDATHRVLASQLAEGRIFSRFEWGEYLTWSFAPDYQVFMDGRIEIYPDDVWNKYAAVTQGLADWQSILDHYGVDALLLDREYHARTGLLPQVEASSGWKRVLEAGPALLYLRATPQARGLARGLVSSAAPESARPEESSDASSASPGLLSGTGRPGHRIHPP